MHIPTPTPTPIHTYSHTPTHTHICTHTPTWTHTYTHPTHTGVFWFLSYAVLLLPEVSFSVKTAFLSSFHLWVMILSSFALFLRREGLQEASLHSVEIFIEVIIVLYTAVRSNTEILYALYSWFPKCNILQIIYVQYHNQDINSDKPHDLISISLVSLVLICVLFNNEQFYSMWRSVIHHR